MTVLSGLLDPSLAFLDLDPLAPELPPETVELEVPDFGPDPGWAWVPADCACSDRCSCEVRVPLFASRWDAARFAVQRTPPTLASSPGASAAESPALASPEAGWAVPGLWDGPVAPAAAAFTVGGLIARLQDTVTLLEHTVPAELPGPVALAEAEALLAVSQRIRVQLLGRVRDVDARQLHMLREAKSAGAWLKQTAPDADPADVRLARRLGQAPHLGAALTAGAVSLQAAELVSTALSKAGRYLDRPDGLIDGQDGEQLVAAVLDNVLTLICRQYLGLADDDPRLLALDTRLGAIQADGGSQTTRLEQGFVVLAEHLPANEVLKGALAEIVDALLPNLLEQAEARSRSRRALTITPTETGWRVRGELSMECGERLVTALAAEVRRDETNPTDTAAWAAVRAQAEWQDRDIFEVLTQHDDLADPGPWAPADGPSTDPTDPAANPAADPAAADAGKQTSEHAEVSVAPAQPRPRPERLHDALTNLLARYLGAGLGGTHDKVPVQITVTTSTDLIEGKPGALPAKGGSGRPLARSLLRRWWCDSHITALILSRGGRPLRVAHRGRTLTGTERTALHVQSDHRCAAVGCCPGTPDAFRQLVPHHVRRYSDDGITALDESLLLCDTAHHDIHTGKRKLHLRDGRTVNEQGWIES